MKVLITGGSGFIGSHVVEKLLDRGIRVRIYDLISPEFLEELPEEKQKMVDFYQGSLLEDEKIRFAASTCDVIYHLAAVADVNDVVKNPRYAEEINVQGTFNMLEAARQSAATKRVIFASTVWMYQDTPQGDGPLTEDAPMSLPSHFYTASKFAGEAFCSAYSKLFEVPTTILRFGVPYGVRARGATVLALFVNKALNGQPLTIAGDGLQYRKFVNVEDLAEGCVLALKEVAANKIYNLEGEEKITIKEIAEAVQANIDNVEISFIEGRKGDLGGKDISNQKAKDELGWTPSIKFKDGVKKYIEWYKDSLKGIEEPIIV